MNTRPKPSKSKHTASPTAAQVPAASAANKHRGPQEVRIIGGLWKRSKLAVARVEGLRPTPDRVRETLFNWLGQDLTGWRCLDAFAGTGALGLEAASRGAAQVLLIERDAALAAALQAAKQKLKADAVAVLKADALAWMKAAAPGQFDLVLLDPPFASDLFDTAMRAAQPLLAEQGFLYLEADRPLDPDICAGAGLEVYRQGKAGLVHFHLLRKR